jgi:hypothetical protein
MGAIIDWINTDLNGVITLLAVIILMLSTMLYDFLN